MAKDSDGSAYLLQENYPEEDTTPTDGNGTVFWCCQNCGFDVWNIYGVESSPNLVTFRCVVCGCESELVNVQKLPTPKDAV